MSKIYELFSNKKVNKYHKLKQVMTLISILAKTQLRKRSKGKNLKSDFTNELKILKSLKNPNNDFLYKK